MRTGALDRPFNDWSENGVVRAEVIESNILQPGSTFELRATPSDGGARVETTLVRRFQPGAYGTVAHTINRLGRERLLGWTLRSALRAVEKAER